MTTDPWAIHRDLSCPECHALGKVISRTPDDEENYKVCVECGMTWMDGACVRPDDIKEMRLHWSRLDEGRPYEAPTPIQTKNSATMDAINELMKRVYSADALSAYRGQSMQLVKAGRAPGEYSVVVPALHHFASGDLYVKCTSAASCTCGAGEGGE